MLPPFLNEPLNNSRCPNLFPPLLGYSDMSVFSWWNFPPWGLSHVYNWVLSRDVPVRLSLLRTCPEWTWMSSFPLPFCVRWILNHTHFHARYSIIAFPSRWAPTPCNYMALFPESFVAPRSHFRNFFSIMLILYFSSHYYFPDPVAVLLPAVLFLTLLLCFPLLLPGIPGVPLWWSPQAFRSCPIFFDVLFFFSTPVWPHGTFPRLWYVSLSAQKVNPFRTTLQSCSPLLLLSTTLVFPTLTVHFFFQPLPFP